jgi:hypothetical protein
VATTEGRGGTVVDTTTESVASGDDIVVIPETPDMPPRGPHRAFIAGGLVVALLLIAGSVFALAARDDSADERVATQADASDDTPQPPAVDETPVASNAPAKPSTPKASAPAAAQPEPKDSPQTGSAGPGQGSRQDEATPHLPVIPNPQSSTPAPQPKTSPLSAVVWTAPDSLTLAQGTKKSITVTAQNPTDGTITLPWPLSCAPQLDGGGVCPAVAQLLAPGTSASATYVIDATGIAAGNYTLTIEGVLKIPVTVTA